VVAANRNANSRYWSHYVYYARLPPLRTLSRVIYAYRVQKASRNGESSVAGKRKCNACRKIRKKSAKLADSARDCGVLAAGN